MMRQCFLISLFTATMSRRNSDANHRLTPYGRSSPYQNTARIATPTRQSSGCMVFSPSAVRSSVSCSRYSSALRTPGSKIVSQVMSLCSSHSYQTSSPIATPRKVNFRPQKLHQPASGSLIQKKDWRNEHDVRKTNSTCNELNKV
jgi:hypothetical protein